MKLGFRLAAGLASGGAYLFWAADAFAGYCPNLVNCAGGSIPTTQDCLTGAATAAALCLPHKQGGEWKDYSDDFGDSEDVDGDDGGSDDDDAEDAGKST
jgi:hypothetical protein